MNYRIPSFEGKRIIDPHVVIIGAGASKAMVPKDKHGIEVPLLKDVCKATGLYNIIKQRDFTDDELSNFELLYSNICKNDALNDLRNIIEIKVREFFEKLVIPDEINLYDYLILSLTSKDLIISFNWDPFLLQAYLRNINVGNLPQIVFPHGNVGVGLCYKCKNKGYLGYLCTDCRSPFVEMPLLFPVADKNYDNDEIIHNEWIVAEDYLSRAAAITIFGYGAPETDKKAIELLKTSLENSNTKAIAPFTIINLESEKEIQLAKWKGYYSDAYLSFCSSIKESILWKYPRITIEYFFDAALQQSPRHITKSMKDFKTLKELQDFICTIDEFDVRV